MNIRNELTGGFYSRLWLKLVNLGLVFFICGAATAQPSGGPYGPVAQTYTLPETQGTIYYVAPDGKEAASGKSLKNPTTLKAAIARVVTGDAIILRGGIYRTGDLILNQSIIMQPYKDEQPVVKGTYVAKKWQHFPAYGGQKGVWGIKWEHLFPSLPDDWWVRHRDGRYTPLHRFNNDMVFINGRFLQSAGWFNELDENSYYIDYDKKMVYIATDPTDKEVEITAFNRGLVVTPKEVNGKKADGKGPTVRGITFTQYAFYVVNVEGYYPEGISKESEHGKDVVGTTFENCTISYAGRVGAFMLGDKLTMRHCKVSDTSTEGVYVIASSDVLLEKNIFTRNNIEHITGYYPAAVKIFNQTHRVTCNDNLIIDLPDSNGIWYDVGNVDGVFTNNRLENVGNLESEFHGKSVWPSRNAFFFEISKGVRVAGNVFVNNDHGMLILNSSGAKVYNNTFVNSMAVFARDTRSAQGDHFGWHPSTGPDVDERINHEFVDNLMVGDSHFKRPLLYVWQHPDLCKKLDVPMLSSLNHNVYVKKGNNNSPLIWLGQRLGRQCETTFATAAALHKADKDYAADSLSFVDYSSSLFKSFELEDFHLLPDFPGEKAAGSQPDYIKQVLQNKSDKPYIGAYPE